MPEENGGVIEIEGIDEPDTTYGKFGFYLDQNTESDNHIIFTEGTDQNNNSPVDIHLISKSEIKPGNYFIDFRYTYFDGVMWQSDSQVVNFHVNTFLEEHSVLAWIIGITIGFISIIPLLKSGVTSIINLSTKVFKRKKKITQESLEVQGAVSVLEKFIEKEIQRAQTLNDKKIEEAVAKSIASMLKRKRN